MDTSPGLTFQAAQCSLNRMKGCLMRLWDHSWEYGCVSCTFGSPSILVYLPDLMFFVKVKVNWSMKGVHLNKCSNHLQNCLSVFDIMPHPVTTNFLEIPSALLSAVVFESGGGCSIPGIKKP